MIKLDIKVKSAAKVWAATFTRVMGRELGKVYTPSMKVAAGRIRAALPPGKNWQRLRIFRRLKSRVRDGWVYRAILYAPKPYWLSFLINGTRDRYVKTYRKKKLERNAYRGRIIATPETVAIGQQLNNEHEASLSRVGRIMDAESERILQQALVDSRDTIEQARAAAEATANRIVLGG